MDVGTGTVLKGGALVVRVHRVVVRAQIIELAVAGVTNAVIARRCAWWVRLSKVKGVTPASAVDHSDRGA